MTERKPPERHPSTAIPVETIKEIAYRVYLMRLDTPMTPEQAATYSYYNDKTKQTTNEATLHNNSRCMESVTRAVLRVLWDMGLLVPESLDQPAPSGSRQITL
jgi:hypothetical protein